MDKPKSQMKVRKEDMGRSRVGGTLSTNAHWTESGVSFFRFFGD
jgi:hypothetical protein